ncbi:MAG: hypothetical protein ABI707_14215 [Ferruginibacter sp.]
MEKSSESGTGTVISRWYYPIAGSEIIFAINSSIFHWVGDGNKDLVPGILLTGKKYYKVQQS